MRARPLLLCLAVLLAACSSGDGDDEKATRTTSTTVRPTGSTTGATTSSSEAPPPSTTPPTTPFRGSTEPTSAPSAATATALLKGVRVTSAGGIDRIELEFTSGGAPGVDVRYVDRVTADGSGEPVAVEGAAFLEVRLEPAASVDLRGEEPVRTYDGPDRVKGETRAVTEVVRVGDFEGVLTWAAGVRTKAPFRILQLPNPARVVIEVGAA